MWREEDPRLGTVAHDHITGADAVTDLLPQAQLDGLTLVTHDRRFEPDRVPVVWT
ncbi:MAG: hypothetical protein M3373_00440 [Gemmatimonadota bacterium]|nr:hypothetical protein [Gemmatimonadota bacterium]